MPYGCKPSLQEELEIVDKRLDELRRTVRNAKNDIDEVLKARVELVKEIQNSSLEKIKDFLSRVENQEIIAFNKTHRSGKIYTYAVVKTPYSWYSTAAMDYRRNPSTTELAKFICDGVKTVRKYSLEWPHRDEIFIVS